MYPKQKKLSLTLEECAAAELVLGKAVNSTDSVVRTRVTPALIRAYRKCMQLRMRFEDHEECAADMA